MLLLMSCGHERPQEAPVIDVEPYYISLEDSSSLQGSGDTAVSQKGKPDAVNSSSATTGQRTGKAPDNMRGFDPASEDDMDDNGMSRYFDNNDDEGWD